MTDKLKIQTLYLELCKQKEANNILRMNVQLLINQVGFLQKYPTIIVPEKGPESFEIPSGKIQPITVAEFEQLLKEIEEDLKGKDKK